MANYFTADGKKVTAKQYKNYLKALKAAQAAGTEYTGDKLYTGKELAAANPLYTSTGKKLTGKQTADYLKQLKAAEAAGTTYAGKPYYTAEQLSAMYNGYDPSIIAALGPRSQYLTEAPGAYKPLTEDELKAAAEARYDSTYGMQLTAAGNKRDADVLALQQQQEGLEPTYTARLHQSNKQYAAGYDTLQGNMASRGLGRSSYAAASLGNQLLARNNAAGAINAEKTTVFNNLAAQITAAHNAYNATAEGLAASKANDIAAYMDERRQQEWANQQSSAANRIDYLNMLMNLPKAKNSKNKATSKSAASPGTSGGNAPTTPTDYYETAFGY